MIRAILDGRKTMTRRVIKMNHPAKYQIREMKSGRAIFDRIAAAPPGLPLLLPTFGVNCPYGNTTLWVRETWRPQDGMTLECRHADEIEYRATDDRPKESTDCHWKPSIFMPRWASRITLEVVSVRVERVQDISAEDALAEGIKRPEPCGCERCAMTSQICPATQSTCIMTYAELWDSINKARGFEWEVNPFCWVVTFRKTNVPPL